MPKTTPSEDQPSLSDAIAEVHLGRLDQVSDVAKKAEKRYKLKKLPHLYTRLDENWGSFYYEVPQDYKQDLKACIEGFDERWREDACFFRVNWTKEEDMQNVDSFVAFLLEKCQMLRSICIDGQIGSESVFTFYHEKTKFGLRVYQKLADAFAQMPNLETVSFYNIRWIPDEEQVTVLYDLFCRNHSISKILLPATNCSMDKCVRDSLYRAIESRPPNKPFVQNRWVLNDFPSMNPERCETRDVLKAVKTHFALSFEERKPFLFDIVYKMVKESFSSNEGSSSNS